MRLPRAHASVQAGARSCRRHKAEAQAPHAGLPGRRVSTLCECADDTCNGRVEVTLTEWEGVSSQPNHFLIEPGHLRSEGEEIVGSLGEYEVVRKPD